eukprot:10349522-Alexandrium_andersonii.AAC.1
MAVGLSLRGGVGRSYIASRVDARARQLPRWNGWPKHGHPTSIRVTGRADTPLSWCWQAL